MSRKKRVYELAKELGMPGQDLAAKLRDLGFAEIKSHMTAMDEFLTLRVQGTLEAHGIIAESSKSEESMLQSGGLQVRKRKKHQDSPAYESETRVATPDETETEHPSSTEEHDEDLDDARARSSAPTAARPPVSPVPSMPSEPSEPSQNDDEAPSAALGAATRPAPARAETPAEDVEPAAPAEAAHETPRNSQATSEREPLEKASPPTVFDPARSNDESAVRSDDPARTDEESDAPADRAPADRSTAAASAAPQAPRAPSPPRTPATPAGTPTQARVPAPSPGPKAEPELAPKAPAKPPTAPKADAPATPKVGGKDDDIVRPSAKRRAGKVVGFVDLSKMQTTPPRKTESRRLRSKDDITPDVNPTLGHDRKRAFVRGDHASRGSLTAGQLREKEAGRFLRHRRPGVGPGGGRGERGRGGRGRQQDTTTSPYSGGHITLQAPVTIRKLAEALALKINQVLPKAAGLLGWGITNNTVLDEDSALLLAEEFNVQLSLSQEIEAEEALLQTLGEKRALVEESALARRPPVIAFLGHVDHGKTTLLDALRDSRVTKGEAGGITQHIGAYQIETSGGHTLTILDTPGHEAFTAMRARGAQATDIVVLVVAADDGVMPSTLEAINHVKVANEEARKIGRDKTPVVVAINKMDKPDANPDKVRTELANRGLNPEEWGGDTAMVEISALQQTGLEELLERVFLESEVLERLLSHPKGPAEGLVLEAEVQEGKGKVAYLLVQDGTLNQGDIILAGEGYGRVRSIHDDRGRLIQSAGPSLPIAVSGLSELPTVGEKFHVVERLDQAKEVAEERSRKNRQQSLAERRAVTKETLHQTISADQRDVINVILKADVQGSLQAVVAQLENLKHEEVEVKVVHSALGAVTESDVDLARSSTGDEARILTFNTGVASKARTAAERQGIEIRNYTVIYELLDDMRALMEGTLAPEYQEQITGHAEVRRVFRSSKFGNIAGCYVTDGTISRSHKVRVQRDGQVIHTSTLSSIRREKEEVKEVREDYECGMLVKDFPEIQEGDVIEAFKLVEVKRLLKI